MKDQTLNNQNNLSALNERTGNFKSDDVSYQEYRNELQAILKQSYNISLDHFPEEVIKKQFDTDSRPGLGVLFIRAKYGLKEKVTLNKKFGDRNSGQITKEIL